MKSLLIITAYLAPFFFIPATFRFAGGIFGRISGMANDRTRGLFDKQRKFRQESKQRMRDRVYGGNRLNNPNDSRGRTWVNNALQRGAVRRKLITEGGVRNIGGRTDAEIEEINQRKANEAAQNGPAWSGNDTALWAARRTTRQGIINELTQGEYADTDHYGNGTDSDTAEQRAARERLTDEIMATQKNLGLETFRRARLIWQQKSGTAYQREIFRDADGQIWGDRDADGRVVSEYVPQRGADGRAILPEGVTGSVEFDPHLAIRDIVDTFGDNRSAAGRAVAALKGNLTGSGQVAGAASFGTWYNAYDQALTGRDSQGRDVTHFEIASLVNRAAARDATPGQLAYGKQSGARGVANEQRALATELARRINDGSRTEAQRNEDRQSLMYLAASNQGLIDVLNQSAPAMAQVFSQAFHNLTFDPIQVNMGPAAAPAPTAAPAATTGGGATTTPQPQVLLGPNGRPMQTQQQDVVVTVRTLGELGAAAQNSPEMRDRWHTVRHEWTARREQEELARQMGGGQAGQNPGGPPPPPGANPYGGP